MPSQASSRPTIGVLSSWPVYDGTTINRYQRALLDGICAAARHEDCHLLLACGIGASSLPEVTTAWPVFDRLNDFVPVGPWNTDGLIVVPTRLTTAQNDYLQNLLADGFPIVFTSGEVPGPAVLIDNAGGIRQAFQHLLAHGHRRIAFIAGWADTAGDDAERLQAYLDCLADAGIEPDPRLIVVGMNYDTGGRVGMQQLLATGVPFTGLLVNNDRSCLGAMEVLRASGLRVPQDVAVIGFDDQIDARAHTPPLTTVQNPTFAHGYQSLVLLLDLIGGRSDVTTRITIPTRLVVRVSCGCRPSSPPLAPLFAPEEPTLAAATDALIGAMAEAALAHARNSAPDEVATLCRRLVTAFIESLRHTQTEPFDAAIIGVLRAIDARDDEAQAWHDAISTLRRELPVLLEFLPHMHTRAFADTLIDRARLEISERVQRQTTRALVRQVQMADRLGLMTAQLLAAPNETQIAEILAEHLPQVGIAHALLARYAIQDDDAVAQSVPLFAIGLETPPPFLSRQFSAELYRRGNSDNAPALQLALLPLAIGTQTRGFVAFDAANLEPCAAIVRNLAAALRSSELYREAIEGRHLAETATQLKSRFLSMVSHELHTPLNLIVGLSEMALREQDQPGEPPKVNTRDIEQIYASAQHLGRLIGDVLDLASSEAGHLRLMHEPLDLAEVLRVVAATGERMARAKGLDWRADLPEHGPWVQGDRTRLRQIALNLISNAAKFTDSGGITFRVFLDDAQPSVAASAHAQMVVVEVRDTGVGVPPAEQATIFNEFHRAERTRQSGYSGLGLGLAIAKQLVEQQDGTIGVRPQGPTNGATFFFTLPVIAAPTTEAPVLRDAGSASNKTILIVDDDPSILALHTRLLCRAGYRVLQARDGREGLRVAEQTPPDLIVLDLVMANFDGFGMLEGLRAHPTLRTVPVIVLSGQSLRDENVARLQHTVVALLTKGLLSGDELLKHIETALTRTPALGNATRRLVRKALVYIHGHYAAALSRDQLAAHVGISADYLTDCFHQEMAITPMTYLNRYRIQQARVFLEASEMSITDVALSVGFSDSAHFSRIFLREVGMTPRAYRRGERPVPA